MKCVTQSEIEKRNMNFGKGGKSLSQSFNLFLNFTIIREYLEEYVSFINLKAILLEPYIKGHLLAFTGAI